MGNAKLTLTIGLLASLLAMGCAAEENESTAPTVAHYQPPAKAAATVEALPDVYPLPEGSAVVPTSLPVASKPTRAETLLFCRITRAHREAQAAMLVSYPPRRACAGNLLGHDEIVGTHEPNDAVHWHWVTPVVALDCDVSLEDLGELAVENRECREYDDEDAFVGDPVTATKAP